MTTSNTQDLMSTISWTEGYKNYLEGKHTLLSNPYPMSEQDNRLNWIDGYKYAEKMICSDGGEDRLEDALDEVRSAWNKGMSLTHYRIYLDNKDRAANGNNWWDNVQPIK